MLPSSLCLAKMTRLVPEITTDKFTLPPLWQLRFFWGGSMCYKHVINSLLKFFSWIWRLCWLTLRGRKRRSHHSNQEVKTPTSEVIGTSTADLAHHHSNFLFVGTFVHMVKYIHTCTLCTTFEFIIRILLPGADSNYFYYFWLYDA